MSSHLALARKWRPQKFEDVIGQRGTVETLKNAIQTGRLAQAFIFAGPRGVGKTTTARIVARALNCVHGPTPDPCGECDACREIAEGGDMDVLEIDGATYTGVDAVREVIVVPLAIAPMRDRFKIFIIDEVHRLSKNAFDALLKSIEEPPPYVKFLMATTDLHAVPATIQSRSQVFELKALSSNAIRQQLAKVTSAEGVQIDEAAIALLARAAEGSMRDALSALDQVLAFAAERVTTDEVSAVLGLVGRDVQFEIAETVAREDPAAIFEIAGRVVEEGFDLRTVCRELARLVRDMMVVRIDESRLNDPEIASEHERDRLKALASTYSREDLLRSFDLLTRAEQDVRYSSQPRHQFEMALLKWVHLRKLTPIEEIIAGSTGASGSAGSARVAATSPRPSRPATPPAPARTAAAAPPAPAPSPAPAPPAAGTRGTAEVKAALLENVREHNRALHGMVLNMAQKIEAEGDAIVFTFGPAHAGLRAQFDAKRAWLEQIAQHIAGRKITVLSREGQTIAPAGSKDDTTPAKQAELRARAKAEPSVQAVLDVFGGEIEDVEEL